MPTFNPDKAMRVNRWYAHKLGWARRVDTICDVLGFRDMSPDERRFAAGVADWQAQHPPLVRDGILGPNTWKTIEPETQYSPAGGTVTPDWLRTPAAAPRSVRISDWTNERKVEESIRRAIPLLPTEVGKLLESLLTPEAIGIVVGVVVIWAGSHFFGVGEIADVILLVVGFAAIGASVFSAGEHLLDFANKSTGAKTEGDLDAAGQHFAKAVSILGVETVLALLLKARPKTFKGKPPAMGSPPRRQPGQLFHRPGVRRDPSLPAGEGWTTAWGDIVISSRGSAETQRLVLLHERVHSILSPKLYPLREIRARVSMSAYEKSYLLKYVEEALAETVAQVGVNGWRGVVTGIKFPVQNGYVTLSAMRVEAAGVLLGPVNVAGMSFLAYLSLGGR